MVNVESFIRGKIQNTVLSTDSVPITLKVDRVPNNSEGWIVLSTGLVDSEELCYYNATTGTYGGAGTITISARGYNPFDGDTDTDNQKDHTFRADYKLVNSHILINDKASLTEDNVFSGDNSFSGYLDVTNGTYVSLPEYADNTARDAAITSPVNGMIIYNTAAGLNQQYIGGVWTDMASGTTSNGSETVAGKFQLATVAQQGTGDSTGSTGARLVLANSNLVKNSSGAGDENKIALLDSNGKIVKFINTNTDGSADTTQLGLSELATDAEALAGTDETRYINSKQLNDVIKSVVYRGADSVEEIFFNVDSQNYPTGYYDYANLGVLSTSGNIQDINGNSSSWYMIDRFNLKIGGSGSSINYSDISKIEIEFKGQLYGSSSQELLVGLGTAGTSYTSYSTVANKALIRVDASENISLLTCDGTTVSETSTYAGDIYNHEYRLEVIPGTSATLYVDGTQQLTTTSNIPTSGLLFMGLGSQDNSGQYIGNAFKCYITYS